MRHLFQAKLWERLGVFIRFIMAEDLERQNGIFGTFIYENYGN